MKFKEGDYVRIVTREATPADVKGGLFYPHFCGLSGVVDRIYGDEICLKVDQDSLPETVRKRHVDVQESIRRKWLNGLSGEARNRLSAEEKRFELAYTILVQSSDLQPAKPGEAKPAAIKSVKPISEAPAAAAEETPDRKSAAKADASKSVTESDLAAAEEEFLRQRAEAIKDE